MSLQSLRQQGFHYYSTLLGTHGYTVSVRLAWAT